MDHFKGKQIQKDVIILSVGYYLRYNLSYRDVQEILYDRGITVCHTTIFLWGQKYGKIVYQILGKFVRPSLRGRWRKLISKLKGSGTTYILQLMQMD